MRHQQTFEILSGIPLPEHKKPKAEVKQHYFEEPQLHTKKRLTRTALSFRISIARYQRNERIL